MIKLELSTESLQKIQVLTESKGNFYNFLGFALNLKTGALIDKLGNVNNLFNEWHIQVLTILLDHYSKTSPVPLKNKLVKYKDIPGGYAYEGAFIHRANEPIAEVFGETPELLLKTAELLGGKPLKHADASFVVEVLKGIPLTYILWWADEFPAQVNILYDESASHYLPTEDLAVLGELVTIRLLQTRQLVK